MSRTTYREAVRAAVREALQHDSRVFLMGEDVGRYGGAYACSKGLLEEFGPERIRDTPLSESTFVGAGIGAALGGMRPIVEVMTVNFSLLALDQIVNNAATIRHMSGGQFSVPLVVRMATGGGRQLAAQHSHSLEAWYAHIPGIKVLAPATVSDARYMLSAALAPFTPVPYVLVGSDPAGLTPWHYVEHTGCSSAALGVSVPSPLVGEGQGGGESQISDVGRPPTPNPSPQGGGESPRRKWEGNVSREAGSQSLGRMCAFHGQMGMFVRAFAYMLSHGADGMRQASEDAVLSANYVRAALSDLMSLPFGDRPCMHEALFDDKWLEGTGITTLDFAKAMIDEGFHPMTVYFPLVVHGAMLIEPTESESKASLDQFIASLRGLAAAAKSGDAARFKEAPRFAPRRRLDETKAAREPKLRWSGAGAPRQEAAE